MDLLVLLVLADVSTDDQLDREEDVPTNALEIEVHVPMVEFQGKVPRAQLGRKPSK